MKKTILRFFYAPFFCLMLVLFSVAAMAEPVSPPAVSSLETVYALSPDNQTAHPIAFSRWESVRQALSLPTQAVAVDSGAKELGGFLFVEKNGTHTRYTVTEKQLLRGGQALDASLFTRGELERLSRTLCATYPAHPSLLANLDTKQVTAITIEGIGETDGRLDTTKQIHLHTESAVSAAQSLRLQALMRVIKGIEVSAGGMTELPSPTAFFERGNPALRIRMELKNGMTYYCTVDVGALTIGTDKGVRAYRYTLAGYTAGSPSSSTAWKLLDTVWRIYTDSASFTDFALFQTKTATKERSAGGFYTDSSAANVTAHLSQLLERLLVLPTQPTAAPQGDTYIELLVTQRATGRVRRFLFDSTQKLYYEGAAGTLVGTQITQNDWRAVRDLLNGENKTTGLLLLEHENGEAALLEVTGAESFLAPLFSPLPKDPKQKAYTAGAKPDYAKNGISCLRGLESGQITQTTVYPTALVQQSNRLPWTPAAYDAALLYNLLDSKF